MLDKKVIVGDTVCGGLDSRESEEDVYLRGFNTYCGFSPSDVALSREGAGEIRAAITGVVEVTDRVVSIKGKQPRYQAEIGDVVVGRIIEVSGNKWLVDVNAHQHAIMLLSNVTEPGGILRRRDRGDELLMRQLFDQEDLIAAEVQKISSDGVISLHSRGIGKYGKLTQFGQLVKVRAFLVKRAKHQFISLSTYKVRIIMGINGYLWISSEEGTEDTNDQITSSKINVSRLANCVRLLDKISEHISEKSIEVVADMSVALSISPSDLLLETHRETFILKLRENLTTKRPRA